MSLLARHRRELAGAVTAAAYTLAVALQDGQITGLEGAELAGATVLGWLGVWVMPTRGQQPPGPGTGSPG